MEKINYVIRPDLTFSVLYHVDSSSKLNPSARSAKKKNNDITLKPGKTTLENTWYSFEDTVISYLCPPLKKGGHIALHLSVGRLVGRSVCRYVGIP